MSEKGSVAPLVAGYLALILLTLIGSAAIGVTMIATNRVQQVADAAVLYAHDRSVNRGIPSQTQLNIQLERFLSRAQSARRLEVVNYRITAAGAISNLELCARVRNPLLESHQILVCRSARAESFVIR